MNPARMRHRLQLQQRTTVKDGFGQELNQWSNTFRVYADISPIGTRERLRGEQMDSEVTHTIMIRQAAALPTPKVFASWRALYQPRPSAVIQVYNIRGVKDYDMGHEFIILDCVEGSLDGQ